MVRPIEVNQVPRQTQELERQEIIGREYAYLK